MVVTCGSEAGPMRGLARSSSRCRSEPWGCSRFPVPSQGEIESGSVINLRLGPDTPPVLLNDALHRRQAHTGAFKFLFRVHALKHAEELLRILHVEAGAVVTHEHHRRFAHFLDAAYLNHSFCPPPRVLNGIAQKILKYLPH